MRVISLTRVVESAVAELKDSKNFIGELLDSDDIFSKSNIEALDASHEGLFVFLAFHPQHDEQIYDALISERLTTYSGSKILVLFTTDTVARIPKQLSGIGADWLELSSSDYPAYQIARELFKADKTPQLPGLIFIERLAGKEAVFVPLRLGQAHDFQQTTDAAFRIAVDAMELSRDSSNNFANTFCKQLAMQNIDYETTHSPSITEWLFNAYNYVRKHSGDIVSIVKTVSQLSKSL